ncbi:COG4 transport protein-domain-containing protein [Sporodiniella umbellata]|nr:COG4 transport protein-domain-containing protein [Sporodiniella umbellata]
MLRVIQRLQEESDKQGIAILDRFLQTRKLESKLVEIQCLMITMLRNNAVAANRTSPNSLSVPNKTDGDSNPLVDPRQLDVNLYELSLVSQRTILFNGFISERANDEMEKLDHDEQKLMMKGKESRSYGSNGLLIASGLTKRVKELMNSYLVIDEYLLKKSIIKAISLGDHDTSMPHTSSTHVDDVFFILKTLLKRSISTSDPELILSTVRSLLKTLEAQYINHFQQKMSTVFTSHETTGRNSERAIETAKLNYMIILNDLDVSIDYTNRLAKELQSDIARGIWFNEDSDTIRVASAIDKFKGIVDKFSHLLKHGIEQLVNQILKPRIRPLFQESYREVKYVLEEDEYNETDIEERFMKRFRNGFGRLIQSYKRALTENNFSTLMSHLLDFITAQWERIVFQTRFNQYGALRFDKDLRSIIVYLSSITEWLPRDKFTRLNQMSIILNFEEPSEIHDLWGSDKSSPINWRLTVNEVKKILSLRLEFETQLDDRPFPKE